MDREFKEEPKQDSDEWILWFLEEVRETFEKRQKETWDMGVDPFHFLSTSVGLSLFKDILKDRLGVK